MYQEDLTNVYKQGIPIVQGIITVQHLPSPPSEQNIWKIKQAAHYLDSSVEHFSKTDKNSLNTQEKNVIKALETDIKHFKSVFKLETPCTVETRTLTKSVGGSFTGPIHPLPGSVPSGFSSLDPGGPTKKQAKKHTCEICGKVLYKLSDLDVHIRNKHPESSQGNAI